MEPLGLKPEVPQGGILERPLSILALKGKVFGRESINYMKAFLLGLIFLIGVALLAGIGFLLFPLFLLLAFFLRLILTLVILILVIWLLGKLIIFVWEGMIK